MCTRCTLDQRLRRLLDDGTGSIRDELRALHHNLVEVERPATVLAWLSKKAASGVLAALARGERALSHEALDELGFSKPVEHLRSVLVASGALAVRDEHLARIEGWVAAVIDERTDLQQRELLRRYAVWHLLRRLRQRNRGAHATHGQVVVVRRRVRAAIALLDWLGAHGLSLITCRQGDLDAWMASEDTRHRLDAGHFVRWAAAQRLTGDLHYPATKWEGPTGPLDHDDRWEQARRLLHEATLEPDDRVAGLLLLLYAQRPAAISCLTVDHVRPIDDRVLLHLGHTPVVLPEPLDALTLRLVVARRGHAVLGDQGTSPWLFPGGQPGRPISAHQLGERLRLIGLRPAQARATALFQLAAELPAALLAQMLGVHISVAVAWQRASAGDWTGYAADVARRADPQQTP